MFSSLHQLLVNYFASIIFAGLDVDRLLDDGVGPTTQGLPRAILVGYFQKIQESRGEDDLPGKGLW